VRWPANPTVGAMTAERIPAAPGRLLGEGRDSLVYDVGGGRVLRRYRRAKDTAAEARMMVWVRDHGMPVPEVFDADGADLVMERVEGRSLLDGLPTHPHRLPGAGRVLADLHHRLAAVPVAPWMTHRYVEGDVDDVRLGVVHCDLHPDNVMLGPSGPVLIDWTRSCAGDRRADLAHTWIVLAELGLPSSRVERALQSAARRVLLRAFIRGIDRAGAAQWLPAIAADRMADKNTTDGERRRLARYDRPAR